MHNTEKNIRNKTNEELIQIVMHAEDYQPEIIKLVKQELSEVRNIDLSSVIDQKEKNITPHTSLPSFTQYSEKRQKIRGWLAFFLVTLALGGLLTLIYGLATISLSDYDMGMGHLWSQIGLITDVILFLGLACLAIYTIIAFNNFKPNAVALGKSYLIITFALNLLALLGGDFEQSGFGSLPHIIRTLVFGIIWFLYLCYSKQVKSLFPKQTRKMYKRDKIVIFSFVAPCVIWLIVSLSFAFTQNYVRQANMIDETSLSLDEYTDGRIIFKLPTGLAIERLDNEDDLFYNLTQDDNISIILYSTYDHNNTQNYFNECMNNWRDEAFDDFLFDVTDERYETLNGSSLLLKTLRYDSDPIVEWSFVMFFNQETGKCCLVSCFDALNTNYLNELINSIRFK